MAIDVRKLERPVHQLWSALDTARDTVRAASYRASHAAFDLAVTPGWALWHLLVLKPDLPMPTAASNRAVEASRAALFRRDLENVKAGYYPAELLELPWREHVAVAPSIAAALPGVWRRRRSGTFDALPPDEPLERYPKYYRRTFHWQADGWLSERSARVYDTSVELLFRGTADVMRRMSLPPLVRAARDARRPRIVDLGTGTGAFLRQVKAALPDAALVGVEMSPHYVAVAHEKVAGLKDVSLLCENAESLPFAEGAFDHALSIFLFHELPKDARRSVAKEALRVLAPGGTFVVCDAVQRSDPEVQGFVSHLDWFPAQYHEPYFRGYQRDELSAMLEEVGFEVQSREAHFVCKVVSARKPGRRRRG